MGARWNQDKKAVGDWEELDMAVSKGGNSSTNLYCRMDRVRSEGGVRWLVAGRTWAVSMD